MSPPGTSRIRTHRNDGAGRRLSTGVETWVANLPKAYLKTDDRDR